MQRNHPYLSSQSEIVSSAYGDVNGDGIIDYVFLTALKSLNPTSFYLEKITLHIQDGVTNEIESILLDESGNSGYDPTLFLGDFTNDGTDDILVQIDSGGSGALTFNYIYTYKDNKVEKIFDYEQYNEENQYEICYLDGYEVRVKSEATGNIFFLTIRERSKDYLDQIYNEDGTLKENIEGMADGVSGFIPVDRLRTGAYEIQAYQRISGLYHADGLGYIINTLQWDGEKFAIVQQWLAIFGVEEQE